MRHIDSFCHFFPSGIFRLLSATAGGTVDIGKRIQGERTIWDLDARFRMMDEFKDYTQVLSLGLPPLEGMVGPERTPEFARVANDGLAELVAKHPDHFAGYVGALPMDNPDAAAKDDIDVQFSDMLPTVAIEGSWQRQQDVGQRDSETTADGTTRYEYGYRSIPNIPRFDTENVAPESSCWRSFRARVRSTRSRVSAAIWKRDFRSQSRSTGVMRPSSTATAIPMWAARCRRIASPAKLAFTPGCFWSVTAQARTTTSVNVTFGAPGSAWSSARLARSMAGWRACIRTAWSCSPDKSWR